MAGRARRHRAVNLRYVLGEITVRDVFIDRTDAPTDYECALRCFGGAWSCGRCEEVFGHGDLEALACIGMPSGQVIVGADRGIHRCVFIDRYDELVGLRRAQEWLAQRSCV